VTSLAASKRGEAYGVAWLRPVEAAESSACRYENAIGLTSILDRRQFFLVIIFRM